MEQHLMLLRADSTCIDSAAATSAAEGLVIMVLLLWVQTVLVLQVQFYQT